MFVADKWQSILCTYLTFVILCRLTPAQPAQSAPHIAPPRHSVPQATPVKFPTYDKENDPTHIVKKYGGRTVSGDHAAIMLQVGCCLALKLCIGAVVAAAAVMTLHSMLVLHAAKPSISHFRKQA